MPEAAYLFCPRCVIGHCDPDKTTLVRLYGETVISIQTMPVNICDTCGYQEFEPNAVEIINRLVGDEVIVQDNTHTFFYKALPLDAQESHSTRRLKS
jgi:hypothetical protein